MFIVLPLSTQVKVSVAHRVVAKLIDLFIVFVLAGILIYPLGPLCGFLYSLFSDGINLGSFRGQSVGKKLMRLQVRSTVSKKPGNWRDSAIRNTPVGVATFFGIIPIWGWLILALLGVPLMIMEIYLMLSVETGHRLGDVMGETEVFEVKRPS